MNLKELDESIQKLENAIRESQSELSAAKAYRPFLAKREKQPETVTSPAPTQQPLIPNTNNGDGYGAVVRNIKAAIDKCPEEYTIYNVEQGLSQLGVALTRTAISQTLSRMAKAGEIKVYKKGAGRMPSTFKKEVAIS